MSKFHQIFRLQMSCYLWSWLNSALMVMQCVIMYFVLWTTLCFHTTERVGQNKRRHVFTCLHFSVHVSPFQLVFPISLSVFNRSIPELYFLRCAMLNFESLASISNLTQIMSRWNSMPNTWVKGHFVLFKNCCPLSEPWPTHTPTHPHMPDWLLCLDHSSLLKYRTPAMIVHDVSPRAQPASDFAQFPLHIRQTTLRLSDINIAHGGQRLSHYNHTRFHAVWSTLLRAWFAMAMMHCTEITLLSLCW